MLPSIGDAEDSDDSDWNYENAEQSDESDTESEAGVGGDDAMLGGMILWINKVKTCNLVTLRYLIGLAALFGIAVFLAANTGSTDGFEQTLTELRK